MCVRRATWTVSQPPRPPRVPKAATRTWLVPRYGTFSALTNTSLGGDPTVARNAFGQGSTWFSVIYHGEGTDTKSLMPPGYTGVAVRKFAACENRTDGLLDAIRDGLPAWVQAVQYDAESWDFTPPIEKGAWLHSPAPGSATPSCSAARRTSSDCRWCSPPASTCAITSRTPRTRAPRRSIRFPPASGTTRHTFVIALPRPPGGCHPATCTSSSPRRSGPTLPATSR
jgi:hypothetical protein